MGRKKVNLQWISNNTTRRVTYKKRCRSLMKKTSELTTLCGVKACVVAYGEGQAQAQPEVWPSASEAMRILKKFKAMPDISRFKKTQSQEDFIQGRISKLRDQVCKLDLENREHETARLLLESMDGRGPGLTDTGIEELANLRQMVETKMVRVKELLQEQVVRHGDFPEHPSSSSSSHQLQASYAELMQQGWPIDLLAPAQGEELGDVVCNAVASTSKDCAGPSGDGGDMTQAADNLGCCSGFPWGQDGFSPIME